MRFKVVIVDLEIPSRVKRWMLGLGIPLVALCASVIAYASVPKTWTAGEPLKSADINGNFASLDSRISTLETAASGYALTAKVPAVTAWTSYTPTFQTADGMSIANSQVTGAYRRVGESLEFSIYVSFSGAPTSSSTQYWTFTLPSGLACDPSKSPGGCGVVGTGEQLDSVGVHTLLVHGDNGVPMVTRLFADVAGQNGKLSGSSVASGLSFVFFFGSVPIVGWNVTP